MLEKLFFKKKKLNILKDNNSNWMFYYLSKIFKFNKENQTNSYYIISDCDGVLTDGGHYYDQNGKLFKKYGSGDSEIIKSILKNFQNINFIFVTNDKFGSKITKSRVMDITNNLETHNSMFIENINAIERINLINKIKSENNNSKILYIGDSLSDIIVLSSSDYSCCPKNANKEVYKYCDYVSKYKGGEGAYVDILIWFFKKIIFK